MNINKNAVHKAGLVVAGVSIGGGAGYFLAKKKYLDMAEREIESVKETLQRRAEMAAEAEEPLQEFMAVKPKSEDDTEAIDVISVDDYQEYQEKVLTYKDGEGNEISEEEARDILEVEVNLPNYTVDVEVDMTEPKDITTDRDTSKPYVITETEYMEDRGDFDKTDLTYYDECGTLTDSSDSIIREIEKTVGTANLTRWGDGCDSDHVVFVRNERISTDFEIEKIDNSYSEIVLGVHKWDADDEEVTVKVKKMRDE